MSRPEKIEPDFELLLVIQYWKDDEAQALALARLIADIEKEKRASDMLVLARRGDCQESEELKFTQMYCGKKIFTMTLQSSRPERGYPSGCHGLWAGTLDALYGLWSTGNIPWNFSAALMTEPDSCPVHRNWINILRNAHARTRFLGKRVTGAAMDRPMPHINGNNVLDLQFYADHPCLKVCPPEVAWDVHHYSTFRHETRACNVIRNEYGTTDWTSGCLEGIAREAALVHGCKDASIIRHVRNAMKEIWSWNT
jgi:hypothetical protein